MEYSAFNYEDRETTLRNVFVVYNENANKILSMDLHS